MNLLLEPGMYTRIKMISSLEGISMSQFIRDGIQLKIDQVDKKNNAVILEDTTSKEEETMQTENSKEMSGKQFATDGRE